MFRAEIIMSVFIAMTSHLDVTIRIWLTAWLRKGEYKVSIGF
jgi:hypothetical protein